MDQRIALCEQKILGSRQTMDKTTAYEQLIERFIQWAQEEDNIRAAVVVGSRARTDHPADEWSDLDVLLFARDPEPCLETDQWLHTFGIPRLTFLEGTPDGGTERRVLFEGGLDMDLVPEPVETLEALLSEEVPRGAADMISRGVRFLVDKEGFEKRLKTIGIRKPPCSYPEESEFLNVVNDFWFHTVWTGKHLRRGELWWAKSGCDGYLKNLLRRMMEWHTCLSKGKEADTWMRGRFLEEWVDERALETLPDIFAHYNEEDVWRALFATMDLFHWLSLETAELAEVQYPLSGEEYARELVQGMFAGR